MVFGPAGDRRFWGLGGPGVPENDSKRWGGDAPHLLECFLGPPGPPKPPKSTISCRPKNNVLNTQVYVF